MLFQRFYLAFALSFLFALTGAASAAPSPDRPVAVSGSVPTSTFDVAASAAPAAQQPLHMTFALKSARLAGLQAFLESQQDKKSPNYHHWLTPAEFASRFGASDADISTVEAYAKSKGFTTRVVPNHLFIEADATVSQAETAFGMRMQGYYRTADRVALGESATFYAPDRAPLLPPAVAFRLNGLFGLTNFVQMHPRTKAKAAGLTAAPAKSAATHALVPVQDVIGSAAGLGSVGGFSLAGADPSLSMDPSFSAPLSPAQLSKVYEFDALHSAGLNGSGAAVGIYSPTGLNLSDVYQFASTYGLSGFSLVVINTDGGNTNLSNDLEAALDVETIIGQAPHATVYIYEEPNNSSLNAWNRIASDNVPIISNSWSLGEAYLHSNGFDSYVSSWGSILGQMQSQGMAHYVATGDNGAFSGGVSNVNMPSSYPGSTAVGGTENLTDSSGNWASEAGWSGSGGGLSIYWGRPSWQTGPGVNNVYSNGNRQLPDVSALGGPTPGYSIYVDGGWYHVWGTSASTPLWASANVLLNQALGGRFGSLNSSFYYWGTYVNAFNNAEIYHDITTGSNGYPTTSQWDFVTGWGSARFSKLYNDIFLPADLVPYTPGGWNTPVMISSSSSSFSEPATFNNLTTYYISGSFSNAGPADARSSTLDINLDGTDHTAGIISDPVNYFVYIQNQFSAVLSLGPHTFTLKPDFTDVVYESNNNNNNYTRTITVRPYNDNFAQPFFLGGASGSSTGTNSYATKESGEPNHGGRAGGASVWYYWTAPSTGYFNFNTAGSGFDTVLGVYTGSSVSGLTTIAGNDDSNGTLQSSVSFLATAGTAYRIAVDGFGASTGAISLHWSPTSPTNDNFVNAQALGSTTSGTVAGSNILATVESGEPSHGNRNISHSVWYAWTAPSSGDFNFNTVGSSYDTTLGVYTGTSVGALTAVAEDDDADGHVTSSATFHAVSGTTYHIAVDGYAGLTGSITLNWLEPTADSVTLSPSTVGVGGSSTGSFLLNADAAQPDGSVVSLHSSNANVLVPATVTVPTPAQTVTFPVHTQGGAVGTATISVTYNGVTHTGTLTVTKASTALAVSGVSGTLGHNVTLSATLTRTTDNAGVSGRTLTFKVSGVTVGTATTSSSGTATKTFAIPSNYAVGAHTITVSFAGDTSYNSSTGTGTLTASAPTSLTAASVTGAHGQTVTLSATLKRTTDNAPVSGKTITFSQSGVTVGTGVTNSSGVATKSFVIPNTLSVGAHTYPVSFAGDSTYNASSATGSLTVVKANTALTTANVTGAQGQTVTLTATLKRTTDNTALAGRTITFKQGTTTIGTATTNASGVATKSFTIPSTLSVGAHTYPVSFAGDSTYNASSATGSLTVVKANTSLTPASVTGAQGQTVTLSATLKRTTDNAPVSGKTITFSQGGVTVGTGVTNSSGVATKSYKIPNTQVVGSHTYPVSFAGDSTFNASSATGTLTVVKANTSLTVADVTATHGTTTTLSATLKRTTDNTALAGRTITFKVAGVTVGTATTNSSGVATKSYAVPASPTTSSHSITASFAGDGSDNASTDTGTLTVH